MSRTDRPRKAQSLTVSTLPIVPPNNPLATPQSPRKARPTTMFIPSQDKVISPQTEQTFASLTIPESNTEADAVSLNSFRTVDTNATNDLESVSSDVAERAADPQGLVKYLCDIDGGLNVILERVKQDAQSCKETANFLKKRAMIEDEYGRSMLKLSRGTQESCNNSDSKRGTYGDNWYNILRLHEIIGENRIKFAAAIQEIADDLTYQHKDTDKGRKNMKDAGQKYERAIQETEQSLEKAKYKYESQSEDWERSLLEKNGDIVPNSKRTLTKAIFNNKPKSPTQLGKQEEDARQKAATANENYKLQLSNTNSLRNEYYNVHLPRMITSLKDVADECDAALQYNLARYSYLYENTMVSEALVINPINPEDGFSMRKMIEQINNEEDFQSYVTSCGTKSKKLQRHNIEYNEYNMSEVAQSIVNPKIIFGVDLAFQMARDKQDVPMILVKCAEAIEKYGLYNKGMYRVSGSTPQIMKLKTLFNRNAETVDLDNSEHIADINNVASVLKMWFRELPDPLFVRAQCNDFINAAKLEDKKLRVITLHELVNTLPDPNYSTLKYLMGHLNKIVANEESNKMGVKNLGIVFGPTLMGSPAIPNPTASTIPMQGMASIVVDNGGLDDMSWQCRVVETILENYKVIFVHD
ncbi:4612_t:CDS:10 [Paraglomus brasilianum]|uniref:4612_t:CDS:1 n=1 Tax=Paraglomus brasilianum TaxID=144538 RepID=A0A9N9BRV8_9GLOM|nr:4612_t:CDS:10 [Paraglomus brasilianum]